MTAVIRDEWPDLPELTRAAAAAGAASSDSDALFRALRARLPERSRSVVDKISSRRGQSDPELAGVDPFGMLIVAWSTMRDPDVQAFCDALDDIGGTCLQGDTHRLFALALALKRSQN